MEKVRNLIGKLATAESRIFISGPAGSGKELVARQIHKQSLRANKPFVVVNGALLDPQKYESELFGVENTNETINYGFFEKAADGTLLIDEVSEIPLETQAKILRVLIDQKFRRVNGVKEINVMQTATYRNIFLKFVLEKKFFETFPSSLRKWCKKDIKSTGEVR